MLLGELDQPIGHIVLDPQECSVNMFSHAPNPRRELIAAPAVASKMRLIDNRTSHSLAMDCSHRASDAEVNQGIEFSLS